MNLDQTAPIKEQSDLGPYCLLYIGYQSFLADEKADDIVVGMTSLEKRVSKFLFFLFLHKH